MFLLLPKLDSILLFGNVQLKDVDLDLAGVNYCAQ